MSSPGAPPAAPTFEASKCAWIMARADASFIDSLLAPASGGAPADYGASGPAMEAPEVAGLPRVAQPGRAEVPVRPDLTRDGPQIVPEVDDRRASPKPVA